MVLRRWADRRRKFLLGGFALALAMENSEFRDELRKEILALVTCPEELEDLPEFFPPTYRGTQ
jgi:hypothetical protein